MAPTAQGYGNGGDEYHKHELCFYAHLYVQAFACDATSLCMQAGLLHYTNVYVCVGSKFTQEERMKA